MHCFIVIKLTSHDAISFGLLSKKAPLQAAFLAESLRCERNSLAVIDQEERD